MLGQKLAEHMAVGLDVRYGAIVEKVQWGASGVTVICWDGRSFQADAAVVTVSLGVLKARSRRMPFQNTTMHSFHTSLESPNASPNYPLGSQL